jgi:hypothetical protein
MADAYDSQYHRFRDALVERGYLEELEPV